MNDDIQWLLGIAITVTMAWLSILVGTFWKVVAMIRKVEEDLAKDNKELHSRINRLAQSSVNRDDLDRHLTRLSTEMRDMREEQRQSSKDMNERLDSLLSAIVRLD